jgi:hypothetical protein
MRPGADVFEDDALKVAASNALKVEEHFIAALGQVLEDSQRPGGVGAPITDERGSGGRLITISAEAAAASVPTRPSSYSMRIPAFHS